MPGIGQGGQGDLVLRPGLSKFRDEALQGEDFADRDRVEPDKGAVRFAPGKAPPQPFAEVERLPFHHPETDEIKGDDDKKAQSEKEGIDGVHDSPNIPKSVGEWKAPISPLSISRPLASLRRGKIYPDR
jgi:hypothetical protein